MNLLDGKKTVAEEIYDLLIGERRTTNFSREEIVEYIAYNIKGFDNYQSSSSDISFDNGYLYSSEYEGTIMYAPAQKINKADFLRSNSELILTTIDLSDGFVSICSKSLINSRSAFFEWYSAFSDGNSNIEVEIYDKKAFDEAAKDDFKSTNTRDVNFVPCIMSGIGPMCMVKCRKSPTSSDFIIQLIDKNTGNVIDKREEPCEEGKTLYSVYYDYMVEKGYFTGDESVKKDDRPKTIIKCGV